MKKIDVKKRMLEVRFTTEHTLSKDQRKALIMEKIERARMQLERRNRSSSLTA